MIRTVEQQRSGFAHRCVDEVMDLAKPANYKSLVKKFPLMVLRNGLLQAVAFIESKGKEHHKKLLTHLETYLREHSPLQLDIDENISLSDFLSNLDANLYRAITTDILAFAKWLSRYAEAKIEGEGDEG